MAPKVKENEKKKRVRTSSKNKKISIDVKMDVLRKLENGMKVMEVAKSLNLSDGTVRSIRRNKLKIEECASCVSPKVSKVISRPRHSVIHTMETLVYNWIIDQRREGAPISCKLIQCKAQSLYEDLKTRNDDPSCPPFTASKGWIDRFRRRFNLKNIYLSSEAASTDSTSVPPFKRGFAELIDKHEVFNVDEPGLNLKKMPRRTYIPEEETSASGLQAQKDLLALLLSANGQGDIGVPNLDTVVNATDYTKEEN